MALQGGSLDVEASRHDHHLESLDEVVVDQVNRKVGVCGEASLLVEDPHHCRIRTINGVLPRRKNERIRAAFVGTNGLGHIFLLVKCSVTQF